MMFRSRKQEQEKLKPQEKQESKNEFIRPVLNPDFMLYKGESLLIIIGTHSQRSIFIEIVNNDEITIKQLRFNGDTRPTLFASIVDDRGGYWSESNFKSENEINYIKNEFARLHSSRTLYHCKAISENEVNEITIQFDKKHDLIAEIDDDIRDRYYHVFNTNPEYEVRYQKDLSSDGCRLF